MQNYILSAESIIDVTQEYADQLGLRIINSNFELNGEQYLDDFGQSLDMDSFYKNMEEGSHPTTSRINTESYLTYFRPILEEGVDILHVCLSSGLSSQYDSLLEAIEVLKEEYPARTIYPVDSLMGCSGVGLLTSKLSALKKAGMDALDLHLWALENRKNVICYTSNNNLEYVARGGRISRAAAGIGTALKIYPLIEVDNEGHLVATSKIRTAKKFKKFIIDHMADNAIGGISYDDEVYLAHASNIDFALEMKEAIEAKFDNVAGKIKIFDVGPTIGSHIGPGAIGVFYWGRERLKTK